ncbi:MAG: cell division protein SepF [Pseudonocardiales bacterium]|nr:cell division protein SepF [Pseudonocardiales bacterium]
MRALHRLKAYFGMVPAEEFDAAAFGEAGYDGYHPGYSEPSPGPQGHRTSHEHHQATRRPHRTGFDDYGDGFSTPAAHHAASRAHPARSPSSATDSRHLTSRTTESRATDSAVHGSLAIDTAAAEAARIDSRTAMRSPVAPQPFTPPPRSDSLTHDELHPLARIVTLHPHSYNEARPIGERFREGNPVIMNLTAMEDRDAKRLVDFAAGLAFALRGSIDKVTSKVFLLSPPDIDVSAEDRRRIAEGRLFN